VIRAASIRTKLIVVVVVTTCASLLLMGLALGVFEWLSHRRMLSTQMAAVGEVIAGNSTAALSFRDESAGREILRALEPQREIRVACLYDSDGRLFASFTRRGEPTGCLPSPLPDGARFERGLFLQAGPVLLDTERVGSLSLIVRPHNMWRGLALFGGVLAVTLVASLGAGVLVSGRLRRLISLPILELAATARRVSEQRDYSLRAPQPGPDEIGVAVGAFNHMLDRIEDADAALRQAEQKSREQAQLLASILDTMGEALIAVDHDGQVLVWNAAATRIVGPNPAGVPLEQWTEYFRVSRGPQAQLIPVGELPLARALRGEALREHELYLQPTAERAGTWVVTAASPLRNPRGDVVGAIVMFRDVTAQKQAEHDLEASEAQLRQAQKMEAVGQLAGGIAHDFNNILTVICGYSGFALGSLPSDSPARADLNEVLTAGQRAATLTRQLLAFSRRQVLAPQLLDLNEVIRASWQMLRRLIAENVELTASYAADPALVRADAGQLDQIVLNLVVNARDAMPTGGKLHLATENIDIDATSAIEHAGVALGPYVRLRVTDTGAGMSPEVQARIFEPFFTTKEVGRGTGLGLSTVYGVVKQSGGHIEVASTPGRGTTFSILLPRIGREGGSASSASPAAEPAPRGTETILLVEDEAPVQSFATRVLGQLGYRVLVAGDGQEALELQASHAGRIDLLLSDVIMPRVSGGELARELLRRIPGLPIVFFSGYAPDASLSSHLPAEGFTLIAKPFTAEELARAVRAALQGRR
jgi:hypothetical protein